MMSSSMESSDCDETWREREREEPLGAAKDDSYDELRRLEDEQELLSSSLFSLTSHLAQVQFRLRQIVDAPPDAKEAMLRSLEDFTFQGVLPDQTYEGGRSRHRLQQLRFVQQLRSQLDQLTSTRDDLKRNTTSDDDSHDMVAQLQTQVEDMQRFIDALKKQAAKQEENKTPKDDQLRTETVNLMKKIVALLQMFTAAQFGCGPSTGNDLKRTADHWGDLRARLEMSIDAVCSLVRNGNAAGSAHSTFGDYDSDSEENTIILQNVPLAIAVRKHLAINIRDLVQHGLRPSSMTSDVVPFVGCFPMRRGGGAPSRQMHAWELVLRYYDVGNGERYNSTPARKLSQSFNLDIVGNTTVSAREGMLSAVGAIIASHKPYKRSMDSHFKAFVCAGLNAGKLVAWLNVVFKNKALMRMHYAPTSYVANTGFQDSLQSLDRLTGLSFDLPVDLAVRQFQNIKDVFM